MRFRWSGPSLVIDTPAKLNLHLEVLGRRPDGFHELETVMVSVGLFDTLALSPGAGRIELDCVAGDAFDPSRLPASDSTNLACRAAEALRELTGVREGVRMTLVKRIPTEAGMGGGSSDAAAALVGLNRLWNLGLSPEALHAAAARLGSDLNFFLDSTPLAICRGRGERITPLPLCGPLWFVVVKPVSGLSTAEVFRDLRLEHDARRSAEPIVAAARSGSIPACGQELFNALEQRGRTLSGDVSRTLTRLSSTRAAGVAMTGSGTACFGICRSRGQAERIARRIKETGQGAVFVLRTAV